jgi:DNA-binding CsgD family transcriptional regulator
VGAVLLVAVLVRGDGVRVINNLLKLTAAEQLALRILVEEETQNAVARRLGISHHTVKNQLESAYRRLGVRSAIGAYRELGWLEPRP